MPTMQLLPGNMETADAQLTTPGRAILNCNIADHVNAGACLPLPVYIQLQVHSSSSGMGLVCAKGNLPATAL